MGLASLLLTLCALLGAELVRRVYQCQHRITSLQDALDAEHLMLREARKQAETLQRLADAQTLAQSVVSGGTATVKAVHKGIASIPFGILEAIPATSLPAKTVRQTHDAIADGVYGAIQGVNRLLGEATRKAIKSEPVTPTEKPKDSDQS